MKQIKVSMDILYPTIEAALKNNQNIEIKVSGNSMYPFFKHQKTLVGLQSFSGDLIRHHIYFFKYKDKYVLHRFIKTIDGIHYFRGDKLITYEFPQKEQIIAEVKHIKIKNRLMNPYSVISRFRVCLILFFKESGIIIRRIIRRRDG